MLKCALIQVMGNLLGPLEAYLRLSLKASMAYAFKYNNE
jgi:hypothetical protein